MAHKISGNIKCMLIVLALHVDTVLMANFQISHGHMGRGKLSVGGWKLEEARGLFTEPDALCAWVTPLEHLPWVEETCSVITWRTSQQSTQTRLSYCARGSIRALHGLMLELFLYIGTAVISVLCGFMPGVHPLVLFQWVNADVYIDRRFSCTVAQ